jgi:Flp pilus assembly protein TadB
VALFRRNKPEAPEPEPEDSFPTMITEAGRTKKDRPTPTRKEAEAARRQRVTKQITPKEARREASAKNRAERMRALNAREAQPEKALMRDYVDARFSVGEFLLPALVIILALSFLNSVLSGITVIATLVMYVYIIAVLVDGYLMWRGFKKVLAQRLPKASPKGLLMYGMNRMIQIRRFRMPAPRIKRGEAY